jgi:inosose dehydratase
MKSIGILSKEQLAYAVWPWGTGEKEQMRTALKDVRDAGFTRFESVATAVSLFKDDINEFKAVTDEFGVYPVSFYFWQQGDYAKDTGLVEESLDFLAANNVKRMSLQAPGKPNGGATEEELKSALKVINRIGELAKPYGIIPCVHPHANTMIMYEPEIDFIMQNTDPAYISMGPDTAHLTVGKCNAVEIFARYVDRIEFTHIKDVKRLGKSVVDESKDEGFEVFSNFLELGQGDVDLPEVFKVLADGGYKGYLTIELDQSQTSNRESAFANMDYMKRTLGL